MILILPGTSLMVSLDKGKGSVVIIFEDLQHNAAKNIRSKTRLEEPWASDTALPKARRRN